MVARVATRPVGFEQSAKVGQRDAHVPGCLFRVQSGPEQFDGLVPPEHWTQGKRAQQLPYARPPQLGCVDRDSVPRHPHGSHDVNAGLVHGKRGEERQQPRRSCRQSLLGCPRCLAELPVDRRPDRVRQPAAQLESGRVVRDRKTGGQPWSAPATEGSRPSRRANAATSTSVKARSSPLILMTCPAASRRDKANSGASRPESTRCAVAGSATATSRRRPAPGEPTGIACTSSSSRHTSSGAQRIKASMTSRAPGAAPPPVPREPPGSADTASISVRARRTGSSWAASQLAHASIPRGASRCARTAWASTVVLPNPGPATTRVTGRSQRSSSRRTSRRRGISTSRGRGRPVGGIGIETAGDGSAADLRPSRRGSSVRPIAVTGSTRA
jgi:hypothetical protein